MTEDGSESEDSVSLGSTPRELEAMGYGRTTGTCSRKNCDGHLWCDDHTLVCDECSTVTNTSDSDTLTLTATVWERFRSNSRSTYYHSQKPRMVGGFGSKHDTVDKEETYEPQHEIWALYER